MKAVLRTSLTGNDKEGVVVPGLRTRTRSRPGRGGKWILEIPHQTEHLLYGWFSSYYLLMQVEPCRQERPLWRICRPVATMLQMRSWSVLCGQPPKVQEPEHNPERGGDPEPTENHV